MDAVFLDEFDESELDGWPNCSVADCEYKSYLASGSGLCYGHLHGLPLLPYEEYMARGPVED